MEKILARGSLALVILLAVLGAAPVYGSDGHGGGPGGAAVPPSGPDVKQLTLRMVRLSQAYHTANPAAKPAMLPILVGLAQERHDALLSLIEPDPLQVLTFALPQAFREQLPPEARAFVEEHVTLEGELEVIHADDFAGGISRTFYFLFLQDPAGRFSLHFVGERPILFSGSEVVVRGVRIDNQVAVDQGQDAFRLLSTARVIFPPPTVYPTVRSVAVILFTNGPNVNLPFTFAEVQGVMDSVDAYYKEISFNKITISADVFGWYTVTNDPGCPPSTASAAAELLAQTLDGFNAAFYDNIIYAFPASGCLWRGLASGNKAWVQGSFDLKVVGHELGHNFGLSLSDHPGRLQCTEYGVPVSISAISGNCVNLQGGDPFSIMNNGNSTATNHIDNFEKGQLNLFDPGNTQTVTSSGTYTVTQIEQSSTGVQALMVPRQRDNGGNPLSGTDYYYLEFRQPYGFDAFASTSDVVTGISIRLAPDYHTFSKESSLIDASPTTSDPTQEALLVGSGFEDKANGITIKTESISGDDALVSIDFGSKTCVRNNPGLFITPYTQTGKAGDTLYYNLTLTNYDTSACPDSTFTVTPTLAPHLSQTPPVSISTPALSPGNGSIILVGITSDMNTQPYIYDFSETAVSDSGLSTTAFANYFICDPSWGC